MESITHSLFNHDNRASLLSQTNQGGLNLKYGVHARSKAKAELEIITAEGDRVTLFSQSKIQMAYASYDSQGKLMGAESSGTTDMYHVVSTNKVAIAVEGDLNEEELADIQRLLQTVEDIFMDFLSEDGNLEENLASSLSLDSMKTLSHFDAELKYSQKIECFWTVSGSTDQIQGQATSEESLTPETGLVSETTANKPSDLTAMVAFKARMKASMHLSGTRFVMEQPAQIPSQEIQPDASSPEASPSVPPDLETIVPAPEMASAQTPSDGTSTPVSTDGTATRNQATDAGASDPGILTFTATYRAKLVKEFAVLVQESAIDSNRMAPVFSRFIPRLVEQLNDSFAMDENQMGVVRQMGADILNTFQNVALE